MNIEQGCNWFIPQSRGTSVQTAFEAQNSCVYFLRRQQAPKSTASCSYFKWAVSSTFKWNLQPPTSLPLKFLLLSAFLSSFSSPFRIQKGNLFVIDYTSACISFSAFVFCSALNWLLFMLLLFFFLYPTHIRLSKGKGKHTLFRTFFA